MTTGTSRWLLLAVLVVVSANLVLTAVQIGLSLRSAPAGTDTQGSPALPWSEADISSLASQIIEPYNRGDTDALYEVLDDVAKNQISLQTLVSQIDPLREFVGRIESAAFSGSQRLPGQDGLLNAYQLNYVVRLSGGKFQTGVMNINAIDRSGRPGIVGFFVTGRATP